MNPALQHLEKIVLGVTAVAALVVVIAHLSHGSGLHAAAATIGADVDKLDAAITSAKTPTDGGGVPVASADAIVAGLTTAGAPAEPSRAWAFSRRPNLRGKIYEKPDLRKDILPPTGLAAAVEGFTVTLSWTPDPKSTATLKGWRVYRFAKGGKRETTPTAELKPAATRWEDAQVSTLQPGSTWSYEVTAVTDEETKQGAPESAAGGPVDAALPYDRRLHYYGSAIIGGEGANRKVHGVTVAVSRYVDGEWRGPEEFSLKPGERIGTPKTIDIDGERVEVDFATHWTLKDADKNAEKSWLVVVADDGTESQVDAVARPARVVDRTPKNKVDAELLRLNNERNAARDNGDHDAATEIGNHRKWLSGRKRRYLRGNTLLSDKITEDIETFGWDIEDLDAEIAEAEANKRRARIPALLRKKTELQARLAILNNLLK